MERLEPDAPVYAIVQLDGSSITLDLSVLDDLGDFAMELRLPDGAQHYGTVYHSGERGLFLATLRSWAYAAKPAEIIGGISWVHQELETMTKGREATTDSENTFDHDLRSIAAIGGGVDAVEPSRHRYEGASCIALTPEATGVTLTLEDPDRPPASCWVAAADLPALVAGMMWRSFRHRSTPNSRLSTSTYLEALDTFERAVRARVEE